MTLWYRFSGSNRFSLVSFSLGTVQGNLVGTAIAAMNHRPVSKLDVAPLSPRGYATWSTRNRNLSIASIRAT